MNEKKLCLVKNKFFKSFAYKSFYIVILFLSYNYDAGAQCCSGGGGGACHLAGPGNPGAGGKGGGGAGGDGIAGVNATVNSGGGGGGAAGAGGYDGGDGGKGCVALKVLTADYSSTSTGSPDADTDGSYTILTFTATGSYTV